MTAIRVIFDGKAFLPQQPVTLPVQSEALVITEESDAAARLKLDAEIRVYYASGGEADVDDAWANAVAPNSRHAWDED